MGDAVLASAVAAAQGVAVVGGDDDEVTLEVEGVEECVEFAVDPIDGGVILRRGGAELVAGLVDVERMNEPQLPW